MQTAHVTNYEGWHDTRGGVGGKARTTAGCFTRANIHKLHRTHSLPSNAREDALCSGWFCLCVEEENKNGNVTGENQSTN